jgi:hypothetical protein
LHRHGLWRGALAALTLLLAATGCVERRMVILTEPVGGSPDAKDLGAIVYDENNQPIGAAPIDKPFTYYGTYQFRLAKDGYETLVVRQCVRSPWYEYPGLDFISENLIPWTIRDVRVYKYVLERPRARSNKEILEEAQQIRDYGRTIGEPLPDLNPPAGAPPTVLLPPTPN